MSLFEMIKCDNQGCGNTTHEHIMEGWIRLKREEHGEMFDGDLCVTYQITLVGESGKNMQIELPESADYCCLDCFLKAMGLKE
jgi:hypothetical protein